MGTYRDADPPEKEPLAQLRRHFPGLSDAAVIGAAIRQAALGVAEDLTVLAQRRPGQWPRHSLSDAGSALLILNLAQEQARAGDHQAAARSIITARGIIEGD
jgi:hypothetical protein